MSKLDIITVAIVIACLGALGYLVYKIVSLMNPPEKAETSIQDTYPDTTAYDETYTDWDSEVDTSRVEEDLDDDAFAAAADASDLPEETPASSYDASELDETPAPAKSKPAAPATPKTTTPSSSSATSGSAASASSGKYMVLAGSYKMRANADSQAANLRKQGFANTEVRMFNRSSFAVVLVDRFDNYSQAKQLVADLKAKGIDALVKEQE